MAKKIVMLLTFAVLILSFTAVFADQNGNARWCNSDEYGCWVTGEDGGKCYIMFWSEDARAYFMGGKSRPGALVTNKPTAPNGRMPILPGPQPGEKLTGKACFIYCANLDWGNNELYNNCVVSECGVSKPPQTSPDWKK